MSTKPDYTSRARRLWANYPVLTYVSIQVNFWVIANVLLAVIMHLHTLRLNQVAQLPGESRLKHLLVLAIILGVVYGLTLGLTGYFLEKYFYKKKSLGTIILLNSALGFVVLSLLLTFVRLFLEDVVMAGYTGGFQLNKLSWQLLFTILVIYYFFMTLLINFINQVNKKYGPGVLVPLLLGKYRMPREEKRIFMFMDLKSSTTHAEKLGHLRYSAFIRDSFLDINHVVSSYDAEIYQYVGDEIVLSWKLKEDKNNAACVHFYFACNDEFRKRSAYYLDLYELVPEFKAGVHGGIVTAVEIGDIKRDIAYHGDVLNTAARIQGLCNEYGQSLLLSQELLSSIDLPQSLQAVRLESVILKGKVREVEIVGIQKMS